MQLQDISAVAKILAVSPRTIRRLCERGEFPQPILLGGCQRWSEEQIQAFIDERTAPLENIKGNA